MKRVWASTCVEGLGFDTSRGCGVRGFKRVWGLGGVGCLEGSRGLGLLEGLGVW